MQHLHFLKDFFDYPCHLYLKDKTGKFLECNDHQAISAGYKHADDLKGLCDYDMLTIQSAHQVKSNDQDVLSERYLKICVEKATYKQAYISHNHTYLSYKFPHYSTEGKIIGLMGISFGIDNHPNINILSSSPLFKHFSHHSHHSLMERLSEQQKICMQHVLQGRTSKEISHIMKLSSRTIEQYVDTIKTKFSCKYKRDLIALFNGTPAP